MTTSAQSGKSTLAVWVISVSGAILSLCLIGGITSACIGIYVRLLARAQGAEAMSGSSLYLVCGAVLPLVAVIVGYVLLRLFAVPRPARTMAMANGFVAIASVPVAIAMLALLLARAPIPFLPVYAAAIACIGAIIWALSAIYSLNRW